MLNHAQVNQVLVPQIALVHLVLQIALVHLVLQIVLVHLVHLVPQIVVNHRIPRVHQIVDPVVRECQLKVVKRNFIVTLNDPITYSRNATIVK